MATSTVDRIDTDSMVKKASDGSDQEFYGALYNDKEYFLRNACEGYQEYQEGTISFVKKEEMRLLDVQNGEVFLDLGCGRGEVLAYALTKTPHVIGIDCSEAALELAKETCEGQGRFILGLASDIDLEDHSVDKILVGDVIEHLHPPDAIAMGLELKRILKPGGTILIHTSPNLNFMRFVYPFAYLGMSMLFPKEGRKLIAHVSTRKVYHINEYTPRRLLRELKKSGMECRFEWIMGVLRGGDYQLTSAFKKLPFTPLIDRLSLLPLVRNLLVNDMFLVCRHKSS